MSHATYLFDLGNTRLKFAPLREDGRVREDEIVAVAHDGAALPDGWNDALPPRFEAAFVASVASPALRVALLDGLTERTRRISLARTQTTCAGVRIAYADPASLGVDRFLGLLAAHARDATPWLIVGIGTALTLDLLDADGRHHGGRIAPSPVLMREALHARAAQLPEDGGAFRDFADTTPDALRSGCDGAALALIDIALRDGERRLGVMPRLLLHGGGVNGIDAWPADAVRAPALVLEGLAAWTRDAAGTAR
ncbi:MAG: type III pantothenate kinase [Lysobacter sp.]|nr:type III pantothenate kinase [Lysobacter sp.]